MALSDTISAALPADALPKCACHLRRPPTVECRWRVLPGAAAAEVVDEAPLCRMHCTHHGSSRKISRSSSAVSVSLSLIASTSGTPAWLNM